MKRYPGIQTRDKKIFEQSLVNVWSWNSIHLIKISFFLVGGIRFMQMILRAPVQIPGYLLTFIIKLKELHNIYIISLKYWIIIAFVIWTLLYDNVVKLMIKPSYIFLAKQEFSEAYTNVLAKTRVNYFISMSFCPNSVFLPVAQFCVPLYERTIKASDFRFTAKCRH